MGGPRRTERRDSHRAVRTRVHSAVHHSLKVDTSQMPIDGHTEKRNVAYPHNGTVFSLEKEGNSDTRYAKWNRLEMKEQILHDSS